MIDKSILHTTLKDFNYYLRKLPKFLLQSAGFTSHFRIWYDVLVGKSKTTGVVGVADTIFNMLNIFDPDYESFLSSLPEYDDESSDILDKIGALFAVTRSFQVSYIDASSQNIVRTVNLNNHDFLILIKAQIIKNYFDGTYEQLVEYYASFNLPIVIMTSASSAVANVYLVKFNYSTDYDVSEDIKAIFFSGLLTVESMGIKYNYSELDLSSILVWDSSDLQYGWGNGSTGGTWVI